MMSPYATIHRLEPALSEFIAHTVHHMQSMRFTAFLHPHGYQTRQGLEIQMSCSRLCKLVESSRRSAGGAIKEKRSRLYRLQHGCFDAAQKCVLKLTSYKLPMQVCFETGANLED